MVIRFVIENYLLTSLDFDVVDGHHVLELKKEIEKIFTVCHFPNGLS